MNGIERKRERKASKESITTYICGWRFRIVVIVWVDWSGIRFGFGLNFDGLGWGWDGWVGLGWIRYGELIRIGGEVFGVSDEIEA